MAKDDNLQDFLTDIADAIREKKGTTEKINPQDFATEITNLSSVEETSNIEYLNISGLDGQIREALIALSFLVKISEINVIFPVGAAMLEASTYLQDVTEIAVLLLEKIVKPLDIPITIELLLTDAGIDLNTIPRITKEEFYNVEVKWVDLGLPSGLLWSSTNVGAEKPEDIGLYFAWGETEGYTADDVENGVRLFTWGGYKYTSDACTGTTDTEYRGGLTKYNNSSSGVVDNLTVLEQVDDAAYQSDNTCRMPTNADFEELKANTTSTWETLNGVNGRRFTSKTNGNSIFVPAAGCCVNESLLGFGSGGRYWSSSVNEDDFSCSVWNFTLGLDYAYVSDNYRCYGQNVRPVKSIN